MQELLGKIALGWVRHLIAGVGVWLLHSGYITGAQEPQFEGAMLVLIPILFSALDKFEAQSAKNKAIIQAANGKVPPLNMSSN